MRTVWKQTEHGDLVPLPVQTGISDGSSTEVMSEDLTDGEVIVIGIEHSVDEKNGKGLPPGFGAPPRPQNR